MDGDSRVLKFSNLMFLILCSCSLLPGGQKTALKGWRHFRFLLHIWSYANFAIAKANISTTKSVRTKPHDSCNSNTGARLHISSKTTKPAETACYRKARGHRTGVDPPHSTWAGGRREGEGFWIAMLCDDRIEASAGIVDVLRHGGGSAQRGSVPLCSSSVYKLSNDSVFRRIVVYPRSREHLMLILRIQKQDQLTSATTPSLSVDLLPWECSDVEGVDERFQ